MPVSPESHPSLPRLGATRQIIHGEALKWLAEHAASDAASVITSLPDLSELPELGFDAWRAWFIDAARRVIRWLPADGVAIFYQSDIRYAGRWVDKGHWVMLAGDQENATLLWHKIVCRKPAGTITHGRASYSHMLCLSRATRAAPRRPGPDVLADAGELIWSKGMGVHACRAACRFLLDETRTRTVVDPFCGKGTALAVANACGLDAIGIDRSARCCRAAQKLVLDEQLAPPAPSG